MAEKKIGAKIVIDGESEFRANLNSAKTALNNFDSELKLVSASFKNNANFGYTETELPAITSSFTLLPPLCFVNEMYETEDKEAAVTPDEILSDENVVVKVRFKFFDVIRDFFRTHF